MLRVAGVVLDTRSSDLRAPRRLFGLWADGSKWKQWYAVFGKNVGYDGIKAVENETGVALSNSFIPNNGCVFLASEDEALRVAEHQDVEWVGERPHDHKVALHLASTLNRLRELKARDGEAVDWVLWSEELSRDLEDQGELLERRRASFVRATRLKHRQFREAHRDLQQQLLSQQTLMVTLHASFSSLPSPTSGSVTKPPPPADSGRGRKGGGERAGASVRENERMGRESITSQTSTAADATDAQDAQEEETEEEKEEVALERLSAEVETQLQAVLARAPPRARAIDRTAVHDSAGQSWLGWIRRRLQEASSFSSSSSSSSSSSANDAEPCVSEERGVVRVYRGGARRMLLQVSLII